jgi:hypothetical protein
MVRDLWFLDPMPLPPSLRCDSMAFYRWLSVVILQARKEGHRV